MGNTCCAPAPRDKDGKDPMIEKAKNHYLKVKGGQTNLKKNAAKNKQGEGFQNEFVALEIEKLKQENNKLRATLVQERSGKAIEDLGSVKINSKPMIEKTP